MEGNSSGFGKGVWVLDGLCGLSNECGWEAFHTGNARVGDDVEGGEQPDAGAASHPQHSSKPAVHPSGRDTQNYGHQRRCLVVRIVQVSTVVSPPGEQKNSVIPICIDQNSCAQSRVPMEVIVSGMLTNLFQALQQ